MAKEEKYIPLSEAAKFTPYSAEYLSLRARQGKLRAIKIGKIWVTKREWVEEYLRKYQGNPPPNFGRGQPPTSFFKLPTSKLRFEILFALTLLLFFVSFALAKDSLKVVAKEIVSSLEEVGEDFIIGANLQFSKIGKSFKNVFSLAKEGAQVLTENFGDTLSQTSQKINFGVAAIGETTQRGLASVSEFFKEYFQWLGENFLAAGRKIKNFGLGIKEAISGGVRGVGEKISGIPGLFKKKPEKIGVQKEVPEEVTKKISTLEEKIKELEARPPQIKEVERKVVVQPVKEVEKITEFIPSEELAKIKSQLSIFGETLRKIQPNPPYTTAPTSPIYIPQGIQTGGAGIFASLAAESAAFRTLGVGASATLGSAPQDKLTINSSSQFNAPITIGQNALTIDTSGNIKTQGSAEIAGNLITQGLTEFKSPFTLTSTSTPQLSIRYDELNKLDISVFSTGAVNVSSTATTTLFAAGNQNQLVLGANGNIGIGTETPLEKLTISGNILGTGNLTIQGTSTLATTTLSRLTISELTPGSVLFAGSGGLISQDNANLFWDNINKRLGIGTSTPGEKLDVQGGNVNTSGSLMTGGVARIDSSGNLTNIGTISSTYLTTGASYVNLTGSASLQVGGVTVLTSGRALQNLTGISSSGTIQFTSLTANRLVATDGSSNLTTTITSANVAASVTDETGSGSLVFSSSPSISSPILSGTISGTYTIGGTPTLGASLTGSGSPNITGIGQFSGSTGVFSTSVTTPLLTSTGALTVSSGGTSALTLDSASGLIVLNDNLYFEKGTYDLTLAVTAPSANVTLTIPALSSNGNLVIDNLSQTLTNKTLSTGSTWQGNVISVTYGGTGLSSVASGALLYGSGGGTLNTLSIGGSGTILTSNGSAPQWSTLSSLNIPTGTGTSNTIAKWTGTNSLGNSIITDDGSLVTVSGQFRATGTTTLATSAGNVGIGTTAPDMKLTVYGSGQNLVKIQSSDQYPRLYFQSADAAVGGVFNWDASKNIYFGESGYTGEYYFRGSGNIRLGNDRVFIGSNGNVGIGTTAPSSRLTIAAGAANGEFAIGNFNAKVIDDMEDISDWSSSDGTYTPISLESTNVKVGNYALKISTTVSNSNGDTVTKTISNENWSSYGKLSFWIKASYTTTSTDATTSQIISIQFHDTGGNTQTHAITIKEFDQWQYEEWDISGVASGDRDVVDWIRFRIDNDYGSPVFYIDQIRLYSSTERTGEIFVDKSGSLVIMGRNTTEIYAPNSSSGQLPGLKVGPTVTEVNQPLSVNVGGDVGISYDLAFLNTGLSTISSEGPLRIVAGDPYGYENLTLTVGGTGDVIIDIRNSTIGFKVTGWSSGGYVMKVSPTGNLDLTQNITLSGNLTLNQLPTPSAPTFNSTSTGGSCANTTYYYRITAANDNGETLPSATTSVTTGADGTIINLSWVPVEGATKYYFYRSTDPAFGPGSTASSTVVSATSTTYSDDCSGDVDRVVPSTNNTGGYLLPPGERLGYIGTDARSWYASYIQYMNAGDIIFANKLRITETSTSSTSTPQALIFFNASSSEIMTIDENGLLSVKKIKAETAHLRALEMEDSETGEVWCIWVKGGVWYRAKGECTTSTLENGEPMYSSSTESISLSGGTSSSGESSATTSSSTESSSSSTSTTTTTESTTTTTTTTESTTTTTTTESTNATPTEPTTESPSSTNETNL